MTGRPNQHAQVAEVCRWAQANGRVMRTEVATHFGVAVLSAVKKIKKARAAGFDIPFVLPPRTNARKVSSIPIRDLVIACTCGRTFPVDRVMDLHRHCADEHNRLARPFERTPRRRDESTVAA